MRETAKAERKCLLISAGSNALVGCTGIAFSFIASSQAILLDGLFNLTYFITGLFTLKVARLVRRGDDQDFPFGYAFFEPLINGTKGVLVLGVSMMAFVGAVGALLTGGRAISAGPAIGYGIVATVVCCALAVFTRRGARRARSPLIQADAENWLVNGAISAAVLLAFVGIFVIEGTPFQSLAPYVDPSVVLVVVMISLSVPIRMAWRALMELLNRAPEPEIVGRVRHTLETCTAELPVRKLFVRVIQIGRSRMVLAHVVLPSDYRVEGLASFDAIQVKALEQLKKDRPDTILDLVFTANPSMGAFANGTSMA